MICPVSYVKRVLQYWSQVEFLGSTVVLLLGPATLVSRLVIVVVVIPVVDVDVVDPGLLAVVQLLTKPVWKSALVQIWSRRFGGRRRFALVLLKIRS